MPSQQIGHVHVADAAPGTGTDTGSMAADEGVGGEGGVSHQEELKWRGGESSGLGGLARSEAMTSASVMEADRGGGPLQTGIRDGGGERERLSDTWTRLLISRTNGLTGREI